KLRLPSTWLDKCHAVEPLNLVLDSDPPIKTHQVRAKLEEHVLAVVHDFAGARVFVRTGSSSEVGAALENRHLESAFSECTSSGEAGKAAADYCGIGSFCLIPGRLWRPRTWGGTAREKSCGVGCFWILM